MEPTLSKTFSIGDLAQALQAESDDLAAQETPIQGKIAETERLLQSLQGRLPLLQDKRLEVTHKIAGLFELAPDQPISPQFASEAERPQVMKTLSQLRVDQHIKPREEHEELESRIFKLSHDNTISPWSHYTPEEKARFDELFSAALRTENDRREAISVLNRKITEVDNYNKRWRIARLWFNITGQAPDMKAVEANLEEMRTACNEKQNLAQQASEALKEFRKTTDAPYRVTQKAINDDLFRQLSSQRNAISIPPITEMNLSEALDTEENELPNITTSVLVSFDCSDPWKLTIIYPERSDCATLNRSVTISVPVNSQLLQQMMSLLDQVGISTDENELENLYGASATDQVTTLSLAQQKDGTLILNPKMSSLIRELTRLS